MNVRVRNISLFVIINLDSERLQLIQNRVDSNMPSGGSYHVSLHSF